MPKYTHRYLEFKKEGTETEEQFEQRMMNEINRLADIGWLVVTHQIHMDSAQKEHVFIMVFEVTTDTPIPTAESEGEKASTTNSFGK
jgi:hypothetical protein